MNTGPLVALLIKLVSQDPYQAAGEAYVQKHTREMFDKELAMAMADTINVTCVQYMEPETYQGYLMISRSLGKEIEAAELIPGYARGLYSALVRDLSKLDESSKFDLCSEMVRLTKPEITASPKL